LNPQAIASSQKQNASKQNAPKQTAWLIDSSIYVFKAWYTKRGEQLDIAGHPVNAVLGFIDFVYRLLSLEQPELIAFAFDESLKTSHRKEIYPQYKANRSPAPESLRYQFKMCREFIRSLGIHEAASLKYEADDLIGTWAKSLRHHQIAINIISADKDLAQLIYEYDHWWEYQNGEKLNTKAITKRFKAKPRQIADQLALAGDKSDNIPGVRGVGMTTAGKLLKHFDNLENLLNSIPEISTLNIRGALQIQQSIMESIDTIRLARQLTEVQCDIEPIDNAIFKRRPVDNCAFISLCKQLNLSQQKQREWLSLLALLKA
jgi:5'-3' exonuclease